jgi:hypothetical protein
VGLRPLIYWDLILTPSNLRIELNCGHLVGMGRVEELVFGVRKQPGSNTGCNIRV